MNVYMNKVLPKRSLSVVALAVAAFAAPAHADVFQDFQITAAGKTFIADKISGNYSEILTQTSATTFTTTAYSNLTGFTSNDGMVAVVPNNIGSAYGLYATFTATGNVLNNGSTFQGTTGSVTLYRDNFAGGVATTLALPSAGGGAVVRGNAGDDEILATSTKFTTGEGHNFPGATTAANGDFSLNFSDFTLTQAGRGYFTSPNPFFFMQFTIDGNFSSFPLPGVGGSTTITGADNIFFAVPEPTSIALLGLGLAGLGLSRRRRQA
jgi:PEP-CTERM motif